MFLKRLQVTNFKNYSEVDLNFATDIVSLTGRNGMGKTNLLDAIYYLSFTKSAINPSDPQTIRHGESFFLTKGVISRGDNEHTLQCSYQTNAKKSFLVDKIPLEKMSDHIGEFPVVLISPNDTDLVREWSELRRKFFDGLISQINRDYLEALIRYSHFLKQRNSLLKTSSGSPDNQLLDQYDDELVKSGTVLWKVRKQFIEQFKPVFLKNYQALAGEESVGINYLSDFEKFNPTEQFKKVRQRDILSQRSTFGVHRDDFEFLLGERAIKKVGSQGQQKSFIISLRTAQFEIIKESKGIKPLLLLDDIFDKLDDERINRMTRLIEGDIFGQIFITDARPERTRSLLDQVDKKVMIFEVLNGKITQGELSK